MAGNASEDDDDDDDDDDGSGNGLQNMLASVQRISGSDINGPHRSPVWQQRSAALCAFARLHRKVAATKQQNETEKANLMSKVNLQLAIRNSDLEGNAQQEACSGKGKYKCRTPSAMLRCTFGNPGCFSVSVNGLMDAGEGARCISCIGSAMDSFMGAGRFKILVA